MVKSAMFGNVFYAREAVHACKRGAAALRLCKIPEDEETGEFYLNKASCSSLRAGREFVTASPSCESRRICATLLAALAGMLQTENIWVEKMVCNLVANTNIRYLLVCGDESPGHLVGDTVVALAKNGVDEAKKKIIGAKAPTPYLYNLPLEVIERFREQITVLDLVDGVDTGVVSEAVKCCYQENPTDFSYKVEKYRLYDPGAF